MAPDIGTRSPPDRDVVLGELKAQIETLTLEAEPDPLHAQDAEQRKYVQVAKLCEWLLSTHPGTHETQQQRVLYACGHGIRPYAKQFGTKRGIILLGTLCLIGKCQYLERLWHRQHLRRSLPANKQQLINEFQDAGIPEPDAVAEEFFKKQWRFCPVTFKLHKNNHYGPFDVLPIVRRKLINKKSETARLIQIEVLEEFVDPALRKRVPLSRYVHEIDGHGACFQFALKTFRGEGMRPRFEQERDNLTSLRDHDGMVCCLNTFLRDEASVGTQPDTDETAQSEERTVTPTFNFVLEYGDRDLDTYFVHAVPPFLEPEIRVFWKELFQVVKALGDIHNFVNPDIGREEDQYKGFHADIKPDNILLVEGRCKLADFGFTRFVRETGSAAAEAYLSGATWTYSAPERLPGKGNKVGQSTDIWSLGCVFSIAATWVVGGYASVRDFARVRQRAVDRVRMSSPTALKNLADGDLFCNGSHVLEDITSWHDALRMSVRQSDQITAEVLNIVDQEMLVKHAHERINSEQLYKKLTALLEAKSPDPKNKLPPSILAALKEINDEAPRVPASYSSSTSKQPTTDSTGTAPDRRDNKKQIMNIPLRKTAGREQYLKSIVVNKPLVSNQRNPSPSPLKPTRESPRGLRPKIELPLPSLGDVTVIHTDEVRERGSAPHDYLTIFKIHHMEPERILFWKPPGVKVATIDRYCKGFDFKFLIDNGCSMKEHWDCAMFALDKLAKIATLLDPDGVDYAYTLGGEQKTNTKNAKTLVESMLRKQNMPHEKAATDMQKALSDAFEEYSNTRPRRQKRYLLFVLTDGIWSPATNMEDIGNLIVRFLKDVSKEIKYGTRPFCIQFIQFGHHQAAFHRLRSLDDRLCRDNNLLDCIDFENVFGDVHKMFLGSHVPEYDTLEHEFSPPTSPNGPGAVTELAYRPLSA